MNNMKNKNLVEEYVNGWIQKNEKQILEVLEDNCIIIESQGTKYVGKDKCKKWIKEWLTKNEVKKWEITSFYKIEQISFFEWDFECIVDGKNYYLEGISIVKFKNDKIKYMRKYRMTKPSSL